MSRAKEDLCAPGRRHQAPVREGAACGVEGPLNVTGVRFLKDPDEIVAVRRISVFEELA